MNKLVSFWLFLAISAALVGATSLRAQGEQGTRDADLLIEEEREDYDYTQSSFYRLVQKYKNETDHGRERDLQGGSSSIYALLTSTPQLMTLKTLVDYCDRGLIAQFSGRGSMTVFAPRNYAFTILETQLTTAVVEQLVTSMEVCNVIAYHILPSGALPFSSARNSQWNTGGGRSGWATQNPGKNVRTWTGLTSSPPVAWVGGMGTGDIRASTPNVAASNGIVHVLNQVLIPP